MDKQKREKLREFDIEALADLLPAERHWGEPISPAMLQEILMPLLDHIDALEGKVKAAFDEGYEFGHDDGYRDLITGPEPCWNRSNTKAALTQAEEKGNE